LSYRTVNSKKNTVELLKRHWGVFGRERRNYMAPIANTIGGRKIVAPEIVTSRIDQLIEWC